MPKADFLISSGLLVLSLHFHSFVGRAFECHSEILSMVDKCLMWDWRILVSHCFKIYSYRKIFVRKTQLLKSVFLSLSLSLFKSMACIGEHLLCAMSFAMVFDVRITILEILF